MEYVIGMKDAERCLSFAKESRKNHYDYSIIEERNDDWTRALNIYLGKIGEMAFKYFLIEQDISFKCDEMFKIYEKTSDRDITDFLLPDGTKIDVKSSSGYGISAVPKFLHTQNYYVGMKIKLNPTAPLVEPWAKICGYATPRFDWKDKIWPGAPPSKYIGFNQLANIHEIVKIWKM